MSYFAIVACPIDIATATTTILRYGLFGVHLSVFLSVLFRYHILCSLLLIAALTYIDVGCLLLLHKGIIFFCPVPVVDVHGDGFESRRMSGCYPVVAVVYFEVPFVVYHYLNRFIV